MIIFGPELVPIAGPPPSGLGRHREGTTFGSLPCEIMALILAFLLMLEHGQGLRTRMNLVKLRRYSKRLELATELSRLSELAGQEVIWEHLAVGPYVPRLLTKGVWTQFLEPQRGIFAGLGEPRDRLLCMASLTRHDDMSGLYRGLYYYDADYAMLKSIALLIYRHQRSTGQDYSLQSIYHVSQKLPQGLNLSLLIPRMVLLLDMQRRMLPCGKCAVLIETVDIPTSIFEEEAWERVADAAGKAMFFYL